MEGEAEGMNLEQALRLLQQQRDEIEEMKTEREAEREFFEMERQAYVETVNEYQRKASKMENNSTEISTINSSRELEMIKKHEKEIRKIESEKQEISSKYTHAKETVESLHRDKERECRRNQELSSLLQKRDAEIISLQQKDSKLRNQVSVQQESLAKAHKDLKVLRSQFASRNEKALSLEAQIKDMEARIGRMGEENVNKNRLLEERSKMLAKYVEQKNNAEAKLTHIEEEYASTMSRLTDSLEQCETVGRLNMSLNEHKRYQRLYMAKLIATGVSSQAVAW